MSHNPTGLHGLLQGQLYLFYHFACIKALWNWNNFLIYHFYWCQYSFCRTIGLLKINFTCKPCRNSFEGVSRSDDDGSHYIINGNSQDSIFNTHRNQNCYTRGIIEYTKLLFHTVAWSRHNVPSKRFWMEDHVLVQRLLQVVSTTMSDYNIRYALTYRERL
jgi:hypothetical protein